MMIPFPRDRIRDPIVNEGRHFLFYGQWNPAKGSTLLPAIVKSCPDVPFLFYPNGTGAVHASAEMNEQSQPNLKIINGASWGNGVFAALADSRAVILPTIWDVSFEYVLFESMGCGKPVIAFSAGAYADYLVHGESAMVVPTGDVEAFATAIHEVNSNAELRARLACGALKTFQKLTDTNAMLKALEKAYFG